MTESSLVHSVHSIEVKKPCIISLCSSQSSRRLEDGHQARVSTNFRRHWPGAAHCSWEPLGGGVGVSGVGGEIKLKQHLEPCNVSAPSPPLRYTPNGEIIPQFARPQCKMIILPDPCSKVRNSRSITASINPSTRPFNLNNLVKAHSQEDGLAPSAAQQSHSAPIHSPSAAPTCIFY